ncbi:MFS transporter [Sphaerochaeta sp. PS]|uniref:MFS transporter n=1 Tax=Sphaerochaeta sp. PS TaxID=3076336 RepID=UPI0028A52C2F|nr:MFS transporter [Sphaerochaeta sp. PS]MDT4762502.1 MFS transporter [Sphaerochaeta sp. PS]
MGHKEKVPQIFEKNMQYFKFCTYGFLKNLQFFEPFLLLIFLSKGLSYVQIGALYAVREISINILEIPSGVMADTMGRRMTMALSFLSYILSFFLFYAVSSYGLLFLAMIAFAFGEAFRTGTHKAMIFEYLDRQGWNSQRTYYYGHTRAWSQWGSTVSAILAAILIFWRGSYKAVFLFSIIPYVLNLLLIVSYPKYLDGRHQANGEKISETFLVVLRSLFSSMKNPKTMRTIANQALYSGYYKAFKDYLQPLLKTLALSIPILLNLEDQKRTALLVGLVYAIMYSSTAFVSSRSGKFAQRFGQLATPLNLTMLLGITLGVLSGFFLHLSWVTVAVVLYLGIYILENLRKPMGITYVSERMYQDSLASALSVESQAESLFAAAIALALGFFSTLLGVGLGILVVSAICFLLALLLWLPKEADGSQR